MYWDIYALFPLHTVMCVRSRPEYFAERLWNSMKGAGTDDSTLVRVVVSRSEVRLPPPSSVDSPLPSTPPSPLFSSPSLPSPPPSPPPVPQRDLVEIKKAFLDRYHKTLSKMIQGDTSGDYRRFLMAIVGLN